MMMAFMVFGKRRRDGEPTAPDDVLAAQRRAGHRASRRRRDGAARPSCRAPRSRPAPCRRRSAPSPEMESIDGHLPALAPAVADGGPQDGPDAQGVRPNIRLTFDGDVEHGRHGHGAPPDPLPAGQPAQRSRTRSGAARSASLDEGDEVVLLEKRGTYWRVLCPDGREGWLHKMTLGDVVIDSSTAAAGQLDRRPTTARCVGGFEDVLRAYTEQPPAVRRGLARRPACGRGPRRLGRLAQHQDVLVHDVGHERRAGSRTAAAASRPGTTRCRPWARGPRPSARAARSAPVNR